LSMVYILLLFILLPGVNASMIIRMIIMTFNLFK
jgi:hypothetical protein